MKKKDCSNKTVRNYAIANDRTSGMTYAELSKKYGVTKTQIGRILKDDEIREILDQAATEMISLLPKAWDVHNKMLSDPNEKALALRAAENILKIGAIMPSNVVNQRITNIFAQQNNIITPETLEFVRRMLPGFEDVGLVNTDQIEER